MKHLEVRQKYSTARRIFNSLLSVSSGDETLRLMFDILLQTLKAQFVDQNNSNTEPKTFQDFCKHTPGH